jgi:putative transposase
VWALDFLMDQSEDGKRLKFLTIVDEFSRYCLSIKIGRKMTECDVIKELEQLTCAPCCGSRCRKRS